MPAPREVYFAKSVTFAGGTGTGAVGPVALCTVTGAIWASRINVRCTSTLTGASATIALGVSGNTGGLIAATTATGITTGLSWLTTSPGTIQAGITAKVIDDALIYTIATANVTGGTLEFEVYYYKLSADGLIT